MTIAGAFEEVGARAHNGFVDVVSLRLANNGQIRVFASLQEATLS